MNTSTTMSSFSEMVKPFSFYHKIFFKKGSPTQQCFGDSVYGRFLKPGKTKTKGKQEDESKLFIDAPRINGQNIQLSAENKSKLYYHGVLFHDIDLALSYPSESRN